MLPQIIIIDHIPLLTNGKTDRQTLLKQYELSCPNNGTYIKLVILYRSKEYSVHYSTSLRCKVIN